MGFATDFAQHYVLGDEIGKGSFGIVYLATAVADGESLAVKVRGHCRGGWRGLGVPSCALLPGLYGKPVMCIQQ